MKEQLIKFNISVSDIELKDFTDYSEFTNDTLPTVLRGTENAINCARGKRIKNILSSFQGALRSNNTPISTSFVYIEPSTFPASAPGTLDFTLNVYRLESFLDLWDESTMTVGSSTASTTYYTADEITKVCGVIKSVILDNMKQSSVELVTVPVQINSIDYPLDSPNAMTNITRNILMVQSTTIPGIPSPTITVSASN